MRADLEGNPDLGGHLHGTEALHKHRAPRRRVTPRIEIELRLAREPDLVVIDDGHGKKTLLGVARLLDRGRELARDHRLAAPVVQRRHVHHMRTRTLCGPCAHGIRRPCADAGTARTNGGKLFAILGAGKAARMVDGQGSFGQIVEGFGADAVQLREPDANPLIELDVEPRENIRSRTEAIDMSAHVFFGDGLRTRRLDLGPECRAANLGKLALRRIGKGERDLKRLADAQANRALDLDARLEGIVLEGFLRAAHAEHAVARAHALRARIELNPRTALLVEGEVGYRLGGMALPRPKLEDIADCKLVLSGDGRYAVARFGHAADKGAAIVRALIAHDVVSALTFKIRRGEPAGESLLKRTAFVLCRASRRNSALLRIHPIEHAAVHRHDGRHVIGRLHTALDLKRRDAGSRQIGKQIDRAEVLRREQMFARRRKRVSLGGIVQFVGQAARLRAQAAVGGAAPNHGGHEALAGIADAQRAMTERLDFDARLGTHLREMGDFLHGKLAGERDALGTHAGSGADAGGVARVHLRRNMQADVGKRAGYLARKTNVLNDERVGTCAPCLTSAFERAAHFARQHDDVQSDVDLHAPQMRVIARLLERGDGEVIGPAARVERLEPEIYRVRTSTHGGVKGAHVARRRQKFHIPHKVGVSSSERPDGRFMVV